MYKCHYIQWPLCGTEENQFKLVIPNDPFWARYTFFSKVKHNIIITTLDKCNTFINIIDLICGLWFGLLKKKHFTKPLTNLIKHYFKIVIKHVQFNFVGFYIYFNIQTNTFFHLFHQIEYITLNLKIHFLKQKKPNIHY